MSTDKRTLLTGVLAGLVAALLLVGVPKANAQTAVVASDRAAGILVYPKIVVDTSNGIDTIVELTNTNDTDPVSVHCFYANALGTCSVSGTPCEVNFDCPLALSGAEVCTPRWATTDFGITLTRQQPIGWRASEGLRFLPCDPTAPGGVTCNGGQSNGSITGGSSAIQGTDDPFVGELKCVETDSTGAPVGANDLIGRATIVTANGPSSATYNAIGIGAVVGANDGNSTLCLGSNTSGDCTTAEYAGCPSRLILNSFFDGAVISGDTVNTRLTLVPCTEFESGLPAPPTTVAQFLVFNEFEQRFSATTRVTCFSDLDIADIDTRASYSGDDASSIFSVALEGTLTGQTRILGVSDNSTSVGHGLLGIAEETHTPVGGGPARSGAINLHFSGSRSQADVIQVSTP